LQGDHELTIVPATPGDTDNPGLYQILIEHDGPVPLLGRPYRS
jgi:hypothetical protein